MSVTGNCHCGKTAFSIAGEIPPALTRCSCSFCSKRGVLRAYYEPRQLRVTTQAADDATCRWNSKLVAHHFCPVCGCGTSTDSKAFEPDGSWDKTTRRIGVNARLFDDLDAALAPVTVIDGKNLLVAAVGNTQRVRVRLQQRIEFHPDRGVGATWSELVVDTSAQTETTPKVCGLKCHDTCQGNHHDRSDF